jgi:hypothetical protein
MSERSIFLWILACLGAFVSTSLTSGATDEWIALVANRNDVSFSVQAGGERLDIPSVRPLGSESSKLFEWQLDPARLAEALKTEFGLTPRQIGFAELCARLPAPGGEQKTCRKFGTLKSAETYHFYFYPTDKVELPSKDIYIIDSQCIIIGSGNLARC